MDNLNEFIPEDESLLDKPVSIDSDNYMAIYIPNGSDEKTFMAAIKIGDPSETNAQIFANMLYSLYDSLAIFSAFIELIQYQYASMTNEDEKKHIESIMTKLKEKMDEAKKNVNETVSNDIKNEKDPSSKRILLPSQVMPMLARYNQ